MQAALHAHSVGYWMDKLKDKDVEWLNNQFLYGIADCNGPNYYKAVCRSIKCKGGPIVPTPTKRLVSWVCTDDEDDYIIQHVPSGPKGMTERVKVPRSVFTG